MKAKMSLWYMLSVISTMEEMIQDEENEIMVGIRNMIIWNGGFKQRAEENEEQDDQISQSILSRGNSKKEVPEMEVCCMGSRNANVIGVE